MAETSPTATPPPPPTPDETNQLGLGSQAGQPSLVRSGTELLKIAVERGYCTQDDATKFISRHTKNGGSTSTIVPDLLVKDGLLKQEQARAVERAMRGASMIAGFEIMEKIGQGGMGAVFRARQVSMDRIVALKILPPKLAKDPVFKQRFMSEAKMCAKLSHLNIINGIDCGDDKGYTYFAMEFVDGRTIKQILKEKGKLGLEEAFPIMRQMCEALIYAKRMGLVHRDIKPDNIMLTKAGVAKLCDLGLAKQTERPEDAHLTQSGQAVGTPHYISPEQARGANVDFRSDIYSLGCTFYHMLTGKTPFSGATSASIMALHLTMEAPSPCEIEPSLPAGFGMIIAKMMAKDSADRYDSPEVMMEDLDSAKAGRVTTAASFHAKSSCKLVSSSPAGRMPRGRTTGPLSPVESVRITGRHMPQQRNPVKAAAMALLFVIVAGGTGYMIVSQMGPADEKQLSQTPPVPPAIPKPPVPPETPETPIPPVTPANQTQTTPPEGPVTPPDDTVIQKRPVVEPAPPPPPPPVDTKTPVVPPPPPPPDRVPPPPPDPTVKPVPEKPVTPPPTPPEVVKPTVPIKLTVDLNAPDVVYARFLREMITRAGKLELTKLRAEMYDLSLQKDYKYALADVKKEVEDLDGALALEKEALKTLGAAAKEVNVRDESRLPAKKLKVLGADLNRMGLSVSLPGENKGQFFMTLRDMNPDDVIAAAASLPPLNKIQYLAARSNLSGILLKAIKLLGELPETEQKRWERKLNLLGSREIDLLGEQAYAQLSKVGEAKDWNNFETMIVDFERDYGASKAALDNVNAKMIDEWKAATRASLSCYAVLQHILHATTCKDAGNDFVEVTYDFETRDQSKDFEGPVEASDGRLLVTAARTDLTWARFRVPILAVKELKCTGRLTGGRTVTRFDVIFSPANVTPSENHPMLCFRPATGKAGLEHMANDRPVVSTSTYSWHEDVDIFAKESEQPRTLEWYINGTLLGAAKLPEVKTGFNVSLAAMGVSHTWRSFKLVFKPDAAWVKAHAKEVKEPKDSKDSK